MCVCLFCWSLVLITDCEENRNTWKGNRKCKIGIVVIVVIGKEREISRKGNDSSERKADNWD